MQAPGASPLPPSLADRKDEVDRAAAALRTGRLVILPTETVYGLFAAAADRGAVDRLLKLTGPPARPNDPLAWHAHDADEVRSLLELTHPAHRRLARRLMPGPITWIVEGSHNALRGLRERWSPVEGSMVSGQSIAVRVPDHPLAASVLRSTGVPVVARSISAAGFGTGASLPRGFALSPPDSVAVVIDDGTTRFGRPSTTIRLGRDGTLLIEPGGALEERFVRKQLERTILFVCTGNTCRSPMAAAIARKLLADHPSDGLTTTVRSAGTLANPGQPATPEGAKALARLGFELGRHSSAEIDRRTIAEADAIFTMTREQAEAILAIDPSVAAKVRTLDPSGRPVPDPIGGPQDVYDRAAAHIRDLLFVRLKELEP